MGQQTAPDLKPLQLIQIAICSDRPKLKNLIERRIRSGGLGVIENKCHHPFLQPNRLSANLCCALFA
jgi:hypothetical protein